MRLPFAVALVVWGAWTGRRWTVPVAGMLALPALWYGGLSMLLAVIALRETVAPVRPAGHASRTRDRRSNRPDVPPVIRLARCVRMDGYEPSLTSLRRRAVWGTSVGASVSGRSVRDRASRHRGGGDGRLGAGRGSRSTIAPAMNTAPPSRNGAGSPPAPTTTAPSAGPTIPAA